MTATLTPPVRRPSVTTLPDTSGAVQSTLFLQQVSWEEYEQLIEVLGERHLRMTYDQGDLEIRMPSAEHDRAGYLFDNILAYVTRYLGFLIDGVGSATLRKRIAARGLEPDRAFYLSRAKDVLGKKMLDMSVDPPPDLAIETDITSSSIPRMPLYAALGVPEVWRYDGESLRFYVRDGDHYVETGTSQCLPNLSTELILSWLTLGQSQGMHAVYDAIDAWWRSRS